MNPRDDEHDLPEGMRRELRGLFSPRGMPADAQRDAAILAAARRAGEATPAARRWRWAVGAGLAAAVALAGTLWWVQPRGRWSAGAAPQSVAAAYQRTGDIRDAYYLARQIKSGQTLEGNWDINRDGRVDEADAVALAMAAVRVDQLDGKGGTP